MAIDCMYVNGMYRTYHIIYVAKYSNFALYLCESTEYKVFEQFIYM